jgi:glycosyltransferase involved in cell wall biosynthesis
MECTTNTNKLKVISISRGYEDYMIEWLNSISNTVSLTAVLAERDTWISEHLSTLIKVFKSEAPQVKNIAGNIVSIVKLYIHIKKTKPDIIHIQSGLVWEIIPVILSRIPTIITIHDVVRHPTRHRGNGTPQWILDIPIRFMRGLIVHGDFLKDTARIRYRFRGLIEANYHPVIKRYGSREPRISEAKNVLFYGTLDEWKGLEYLAKAILVLNKQGLDINFIIAGYAADPDYYTTLFKDCRNTSIFTNRQSAEQTRQLFENADILLIPYIEASQSGVLHLGISFCLPTIVTNVGSLPEVVTNGVSAVVIRPCEADELAKAISNMYSNSALRNNLSIGMKQLRDVKMSDKVIAERTLNIYLKALG